jgi:hypothetical protein
MLPQLSKPGLDSNLIDPIPIPIDLTELGYRYAECLGIGHLKLIAGNPGESIEDAGFWSQTKDGAAIHGGHERRGLPRCEHVIPDGKRARWEFDGNASYHHMATRWFLHMKVRLGKIRNSQMRYEIQISSGKDPIPLSDPDLDCGSADKHRVGFEELEGVKQGFGNTDRSRCIVPADLRHGAFLLGGRRRAPPSRTLLSLS